MNTAPKTHDNTADKQPTNDNAETLSALLKAGVIRTTPKRVTLGDLVEQGTVRTQRGEK
jgi:hypothetical protein